VFFLWRAAGRLLHVLVVSVVFGGRGIGHIGRIPKLRILIIGHLVAYLQNLRQFPLHLTVDSQDMFFFFDGTCELLIIFVAILLLDHGAEGLAAGTARAIRPALRLNLILCRHFDF